MDRNKHKYFGFSLIEILVVIAVISFLSSVVLSNSNEARAIARDAKRVAETREIVTALELYRKDKGHYPCSTAELSSQNIFLKELVDEGYLSNKPEDPINKGSFRYYYKSMRDTATSPCGEYAFLTYDRETPGTECILGGTFVPAFPDHCHVPLPKPLPCPDPYLYSETSGTCGTLKNDSG